MIIDVTEDMRVAFEKGTILTDHGLEWKKPGDRGYGKCYWNTEGFSIQILAHRVAWILAKGPIPRGFDIDHDPACPKTCVTVEHLQALSRSDHLKLGWKRGELNGGWGTKRIQIHPDRPPAFEWQTERTCKNCETIFIPRMANQVHCSSECRISYKERVKGKKKYPRPKLIVCWWCGKEFVPKRKDSKLCPRPSTCIDSAQNEKKKSKR